MAIAVLTIMKAPIWFNDRLCTDVNSDRSCGYFPLNGSCPTCYFFNIDWCSS